MRLNALVWHVRARVEKLGALGVAGVAAAIFALVFQLCAVNAVDADLADLRAQAERLHARNQLEAERPANARAVPGAQLATFYEFFPAVGSLPEWLLKIDAAAARQGVALDLGDYRLVQEKSSRLARYQIMLPIKGSYEQIRGFVAAVLNDVPAAALEDISLKRETIGAINLEARLKLTLYLRPENW
ncbi:MAG: putative transrane protein [Betaproteobacteria bacterium]|nr:putative transrane protein [Betaproteobacteria bacterium]